MNSIQTSQRLPKQYSENTATNQNIYRQNFYNKSQQVANTRYQQQARQSRQKSENGNKNVIRPKEINIVLKPRQESKSLVQPLQENKNQVNQQHFNHFVNTELKSEPAQRPLSQSECINVSLVNLEFLQKMPQHYMTITHCQRLLKNIKVLNTFTPNIITQCISQPAYQALQPENKLSIEQIQGLKTLHDLWQQEQPQLQKTVIIEELIEQETSNANDTSIETRSDLSSLNMGVDQELEQAKLDLVLNGNQLSDQQEQMLQTEQIILQTRLVQIDEVSHSSQASSSHLTSRAHSRQQTLSKQQFSLNLNQCQILDCGGSSQQQVSAQSFLNGDLKYQISKVQEEEELRRESEDSPNDFYLSPHLLALESKMETQPNPYHDDETLGFVYENDNQSVIRITSHGFHVNNINASDTQSQVPIGHLTSDYLYGQSTFNYEEFNMHHTQNQQYQTARYSNNEDNKVKTNVLLYATPPQANDYQDRDEKPLKANPLTFEQLLDQQMKAAINDQSSNSSIPKETPKDFSVLQILDTFEDPKGEGNGAPKEFMQSLDGSLERILKSSHGISTHRPFLKKGNGFINKKLKNWEQSSISSFTMSKSSSRRFFDTTQENKNKKSNFQSPGLKYGSVERFEDNSCSPIDNYYVQKMSSLLQSSVAAENISRDVANRLTTLKERYSNTKKQQAKIQSLPVFDEPKPQKLYQPKQQVLEKPMNIEQKQKLEMQPLSEQKRHVSSSPKIQLMPCNRVIENSKLDVSVIKIVKNQARKQPSKGKENKKFLHQINEEKTVSGLKVDVFSLNATKPVPSLKQKPSTVPNSASRKSYTRIDSLQESVQRQPKNKENNTSAMKNIQSQIDNQEKMIQILRDEIKQREKQMKQSQSKMKDQIHRLEKENYKLKIKKQPEQVVLRTIQSQKTTPLYQTQQLGAISRNPRINHSSNSSLSKTINVKKVMGLISRTQLNSAQSTSKNSIIEITSPASIQDSSRNTPLTTMGADSVKFDIIKLQKVQSDIQSEKQIESIKIQPRIGKSCFTYQVSDYVNNILKSSRSRDRENV